MKKKNDLNPSTLLTLSLFFLTVALPPAFSQAATVNVTVNAASVVRTLPNELFGQNMSVYDSSATAGNTNYTAAIAAMSTANLRFPGGGYGDMVDWNNIEAGPFGSCGSGGAWMINMQEGIAFANASGTRLQCIVNYGGRWCPTSGPNQAAAQTKAANWVSYMNVTGGGAHRVVYWEIGNEIFFNGDPGYEANGTTYGTNFVGYWNAMKAVDPTIKIGAMCQFDYAAWSQAALTAIRGAGITPDFVICHAYPIFNPTDSTAEDQAILGTEVDNATVRTTQLNNILTGAGYSAAQANAMPKWMTEYRTSVPDNKAVEFVDAMWSAQYLLELGRNGWGGANIWAIKNGYGTGTNSDYGLLRGGNACGNCDDTPVNTPRPAWYIFPYLSRVFGRNLVTATSNNALVRSWASKDAAGNLTIFMVNNDLTNTHTGNISIAGFSPGAAGVSWTMVPAGFIKNSGSATTPNQQRRHISINGVVNPAVGSVPGAGAAFTTGANFSVNLPSASMVLVRVPSGGTPIPTDTPTRTPTPTPTQCSVILNGCNSAAQNGTWSGINAARTFIGAGYPPGALTEGTTLMQVAVTTGSAYQADMMILTGFTPNLFTGAVQLKVDINAPATFITAAGGWHDMVLIADSSSPVTYFQQLSSNTPSLVAGQQTLTFNLDYPGGITPSMPLANIRLVLNAQNPALGTLYVDNIRLLNACGAPTNTPTPTPCVVLFNGAENLTQNGNWTGINATRSIVTAPPAAIVQGTSALRVQVTAPSSYNTDLFNLDSFAPGNWYGVTRISANIYVEPTLLAGQTYNQLLLYADSFPATTYQPISSTGPSLVAGANLVTWTIDYREPGSLNPSGISAGMPLSKLIFVWNNGPVSTNLGSFYVDNIQMLRDGCLPTPTNTRTFTPTVSPTNTITPTNTRTNTPTNSPTYTRTNTPTNTTAITNTPTNTITQTATFTPTRTPTPSFTSTPTVGIPTNTSTPTFTNTRTNTPSNTVTNTPFPFTNTPTSTFTSTRTNTSTFTATFTPTRTNTPTFTNSFTNTPLITNTPTNTPTVTRTNTSTFTATNTNTPTSTATFTNTRTSTATFTNSFTPTSTSTFTSTRTNTPTSTSTNTNTRTHTPTSTNSFTSTSTPTFTLTRTNTATFTNSFTPTITYTPTLTFTGTLPPTNTPTNTATSTRTFTPSFTATHTNTPTSTPTSTNTFTNTRTSTPTFTSVFTNTPTFTGVFTNTSTNTPTRTPTSTNTSTNTVTPTSTFTNTRTNTSTSTPSSTPTGTPTFTNTNTSTRTNTPTITSTSTNTFTGTVPPTNTPSATASPTPTSTPTSTGTNTLSPTSTFTPTATSTSTHTSTNTNTRTPTATFTSTSTSTRTFTPTVTSTSTNSPTGTVPPTNTPTNTNSPTRTFTAVNTFTSTSTSTAVPTNTSTFTPTRTFTPSPTPTSSFTPTRTFTPAATATSTTVTVQVGVGPASAPGSTQLPGGSNVPMLQIQMTDPGGSAAVLNSVTLTASGSGNDASGVSSVSLYRDSNNNGVVDAGDTLLASGSYPSDNGSLTLNFSSTIVPFGTVNLLVAYNFNAGALPGSYQVNVTSNASLSGTDNGNGQPLSFTGAPIGGAVIMIATATSTPTASSTVTRTPTASSTATAAPTTGSKPVLYPNPATGPGPVTIQYNLASAGSDVKVLVFTTAFRKINEISIGQVPAGTNKTALQLADRWGSPLANGIYYVVIRNDQERYTVKLMVIR